MAENVHTISDLYQMQALPLKLKIALTKRRIRDWVNWYGESGVYVSFSGGKDSTVLLHIAREMYPNIKAVYVDTGLEYPEIRHFVKTFDNVDWVRPKKHFKQVCEEYGFPIISKEVSECVYGARKYLTNIMAENSLAQTDRQTDRQTVPYAWSMADILGIDRRINKRNQEYQNLKMGIIPSKKQQNIPVRYKILTGQIQHKKMGKATDEYSSMYNKSRWKFFLDAPFEISNMCCRVMKKEPAHRYNKDTGRMPITAQMASESKLRTTKWLQNGCNAFNIKNPISNPMSFWTEQDVLLYIKTHNIPIASIYGDIVIDYTGMGQVEGQMSFADFMDAEEFDLERPLLKTTGCDRTGCVFCGFGCHLEKGESRFEGLKKTHPKHYKAMANIKNNGVNYFEAIDWINENNGKGEIIRY